MTANLRISLKVASLTMLWLSASGCRPTPPGAAGEGLPPAYTSGRITDPGLRQVAEEIQGWADKQVGAGSQRLFGRIEVLPPAETVQPYGVGAYQQELRLPVILTTGPGWTGLKPAEKETAAAQTFQAIARQLQTLKRNRPLQPTLTIQSPQGIELAWINHLDAGGRNVHGDE